MKVTCSVQARLGSTRLPGKVLFNLGKKRVIEWVVERGTASDLIDTTYVAVGGNPENDALVELCERANLCYVRGPEDDLVARHNAVLETAECDVFCRVTGDCPFLPTEEITRVVRKHLKNDAIYTTNHTYDMPIGTAVDVFDPEVLVDSYEKGYKHPVKHLRERSDEQPVVVTGEDRWQQFSEAHTAVDTPEDYWRLIDAIDAVGPEPFDVTQWVAEQS